MSVFQSPEFYDVLSSSSELSPFRISLNNSDGFSNIQGYVTQLKNPLKNYFSRRAIIIGNPNITTKNSKYLGLLLADIINYLKKKVIYVEFRNLSDQQEFIEYYQRAGFVYEDHLNIIVDLTKTEEQLWKDIYPKRRNEIRRASKEGTTFEIKDDIESLRECYFILQQVYNKAKIPLFKLDFFENLCKYLIGDTKLHIFTAVYERKIIGCMLALGHNGVLFDYYAGAKQDYYNKYPNDLIPWEVFKWGKKNGYHTFDFGGAGKPGVPYKVRDYKKQFGGTIVNYGRFKCILNKPLYRIGEMGVKLMKKL